MNEPVIIRRIQPEEWQAYRALRLEALRDTPAAFGSTYAQSVQFPDIFWQDRLRSELAYFGAYADGALRGTASLGRETSGNMVHRGGLYGMYVGPDLRGTGTGLRLVQAVLEEADQIGCLQVHLGVGVFNVAAQKLYERAGFQAYGTEPRGLIVDGKAIDEILMVRFLDQFGNE